MYSVSDEQEARDLLVRACGTNLQGEFVAAELVEEQTLDNLAAFSDRLDGVHTLLREAGRCRCGGRSEHQLRTRYDAAEAADEV